MLVSSYFIFFKEKNNIIIYFFVSINQLWTRAVQMKNMEVISSSSPAQLNGGSTTLRKKDTGIDPKENLWYAFTFERFYYNYVCTFFDNFLFDVGGNVQIAASDKKCMRMKESSATTTIVACIQFVPRKIDRRRETDFRQQKIMLFLVSERKLKTKTTNDEDDTIMILCLCE